MQITSRGSAIYNDTTTRLISKLEAGPSDETDLGKREQRERESGIYFGTEQKKKRTFNLYIALGCFFSALFFLLRSVGGD